MFWCIFFAIIGIIFLLGMIWFFSPYFKYKKNLKSRKGRFVTIIERGEIIEEELYLFKEKIEDLVELSVIVPAYNEEERLPIMLDQTFTYLEEKKAKSQGYFSYEFVIIDDGSKDSTWEAIRKYSRSETRCIIRGVRLSRNSGKGCAVKKGMIYSKGKMLLMVDADGATDINDFDRVELGLMEVVNARNLGVSVGSRQHLSEAVVVKRTFIRNMLMYIMHFMVQKVCAVPILDTQCGFKLFTRDTARILFEILHLERWAFDVELLFLAGRHKIGIAEIPVNWQEIAGSKVNVLFAPIEMARDILLIRLLYLFKLWKYTDKSR